MLRHTITGVQRLYKALALQGWGTAVGVIYPLAPSIFMLHARKMNKIKFIQAEYVKIFCLDFALFFHEKHRRKPACEIVKIIIIVTIFENSRAKLTKFLSFPKST